MSNNPRERGAPGQAVPPPPPPPAHRKAVGSTPAPRELSSAADVLNPSALLGMLVGHFRLLEIIGYGGFGVVYLAEHVHLGQKFALKLVRSHQQHDNDLLKRFQREANTLAALHHPNIVRLKDFGQLGDHGLYFAMEYLRGRDLKEVLTQDYPLSLERIRRIMGQICDALRYMHSKQIYHRDLKPANVIVVPQGGGLDLAKLIDFGIASAVTDEDTSLTHTGMLMGSMPYISPEQARGDSALIDGRSDLYSLGIMLYQLLTQELPYQSNHIPGLLTHHLFTPPPSLKKYRPGQTWSPSLDAFIAKALAKLPDDRFPTAAVFWKELLVALAEQPPLERGALASSFEPLLDDSLQKMLASDAREEAAIPLYGKGDSIETLLFAASTHEVEDEIAFPWGEEPGDVEVTSLLRVDLIAEQEAVVELFASDELGLEVAPTFTDLDRELLPLRAANSESALLSHSQVFGPSSQSVVRSVQLVDSAELQLSESVAASSEPRSGNTLRDLTIFVCFLLLGGVFAYALLFSERKPQPVPLVSSKRLGALPALRTKALLRGAKGSISAQTQARGGLWSWRLETLPAGATITQKGRVVGQTPYTFRGAPGEEIRVTLAYQGFRAQSLQWRLQRESDHILLPLTPVELSSRPPIPRRRGVAAPWTRRRVVRRASTRWTPPRRAKVAQPRPRPRKRIYDVADPF